MGRLRRRRLAVGLGVGTLAIAAVVTVMIVPPDDDGPSGARPLRAASGPTTTSRLGSSTASAPSTPSSSSPSSTAPVPTTTTLAPAAPARPTTTAAAASSTTTSTTAAPSPADCRDPEPSSDFDGFAADVVVIEDDRGAHESCMLIADTPERRRQGLMDQDDLDGYAGMAFVFDDEDERSFWMQDTRIPLSIAFFDGEGRFVSAKDMEPCDDGADCPTYSSDGAAQFAVEVVQGRLPLVGATPGSRLER